MAMPWDKVPAAGHQTYADAMRNVRVEENLGMMNSNQAQPQETEELPKVLEAAATAAAALSGMEVSIEALERKAAFLMPPQAEKDRAPRPLPTEMTSLNALVYLEGMRDRINQLSTRVHAVARGL